MSTIENLHIQRIANFLKSSDYFCLFYVSKLEFIVHRIFVLRGERTIAAINGMNINYRITAIVMEIGQLVL